MGITAKAGGVTYMVRVRREGVEPDAGCLLFWPIKLWTWLAWRQQPNRRWSVETTKMRRIGIGGQRIGTRTFETRPEALAFGDEELARLRNASTEDGAS